jgi:glucose/arabinose dehydrogenase
MKQGTQTPMSRTLLLTLCAMLFAGCNPAGHTAAEPAASGARPFKVEQIADFDSPWAMTFLPDGRMLITEKAGTLLLVTADGRQRRRVAGIPEVMSEGQGGLMDVVLHPKFAQNHLVYFSYTESRGGAQGVVLARGVLADGQAPALRNVETLFRASFYADGGGHFSGRIAFAPDGKLFFTNGERERFTPAQDPKVTLGKVLRLNDDGTPAAGNPLAARGFHPAVWSYGHRNLLGLAFDANGNLWEQEMGPAGGDEVNLILAGRNYGWPRASNGTHYDGRDIPDHRPGDGFEAPKVWWNPSISPAGLMVYSGKLWPQWRGDIFIGGLTAQALLRVDVDGATATKGNQWPMGTRIREVEEGPDGAIWLLQDGQASKLLKLTPVSQ